MYRREPIIISTMQSENNCDYGCRDIAGIESLMLSVVPAEAVKDLGGQMSLGYRDFCHEGSTWQASRFCLIVEALFWAWVGGISCRSAPFRAAKGSNRYH